ncbi:alpha/beta fold hydrolase [Glutamicibacter halophytocola]|uniref:alpha/beta fold hydrolase n=1 Tax=Glutamicibacter halophytocola TaxID=1933880 RepID=UPI00321C39F7
MTSTERPQVVLPHGVGLDHTMWRPLREHLSHETVALDLPGHGGQPPLRTEQDLASLAADVLARLDTRAPVHLVGFSLGALIAQHLARFAPRPGAHPDRGQFGLPAHRRRGRRRGTAPGHRRHGLRPGHRPRHPALVPGRGNRGGPADHRGHAADPGQQ